MDHQLEALLSSLLACPPAERIDHREAILAFGAAAVVPLRELVAENRKLGPQVCAWLEVLAKRDESAKSAVVAALHALAKGDTYASTYAEDCLQRLGVPARQGVTPRSSVLAIRRSAGTDWPGFQEHEFGRNEGTSWRSADGQQSLAPIITIVLRELHPDFISYGVERSPEIHFALAQRYKGTRQSGFTSSKLVVYANGQTDEAPDFSPHVVAGWCIEKGDGIDWRGPVDDGQLWDWPLFVRALGNASFQVDLSRVMVAHGLSFGDYVGGRFATSLGWVAHMEDGVPVARSEDGDVVATGWADILGRLEAATDQEVDIHICRTWPAAEAIAAGQPFALRELAPCLLDLGRLYLEAIGPRI